MTRAVTILTCSAMAVTSACTDTTGARVDSAGAQELVALCMEQTQAPGAYNWRFDGRLPVAAALPDFGGTREGANMVNACVRQNAVLYQPDAAPTPVMEAAPDPVLSDPEPTPVATTPDPVPVMQTPAAPRPAASSCPPGITGLYRGTILC